MQRLKMTIDGSSLIIHAFNFHHPITLSIFSVSSVPLW